MSHSNRAVERRLKRKHITKHGRDIMDKQHWGDSHPSKKQDQADRDKSLAAKLGLIKQ